ncbi:transporter substrate-binding domain-containing protein [Halobacteriovorax sp. JY17]|uniref:substrate-binding periplasmic protein n=1 Tax=Halobacteriovorax sp. JY17 TaxID=2014617 RepID=UPI000C5CBCEE|nr:transporter substrate-binding domain-containing protein [Halobacteriovorax sp. JY17]PIK15248.1 MAG: hypothetical protein CES88_00635 [Halobacteriovorax sp. JY17]
MKKLIYLLLVFSLSSQIVAKEKVSIATFLIPRYVQSETNGEFITLVKKLAEIAGYEISLTVLPPKRAIQKFTDGEFDGYFPGVDSISPKNIYKTSDFYIKEDFIFQMKGSDYKKIAMPKVCLTGGYPYAKEVLENKKWEILYGKSDENCLELLKINRVQLFIGEEFTIMAALKSLKLSDKVFYDRFTPVSTQGVYFAFSETKRGKIISQKFDKALKKMVMDGSFDSLFPEKKR